jgi:hypothetical protein
MELFSKRNNKGKNIQAYRFRHRQISDEEEIKLISDNTRVRLHEQLKFFCCSEIFLERGFIVHDENREVFYLHQKILSDFSSREIGYDIGEYVKMETLEFRDEKIDDSKFFDFIETILIFAKDDVRESLVARLNKIFKEESEQFIIHGFMIVETEHSGLRSALPLIKDAQLQKSIREYYRSSQAETQFEILAKISAGILQRITTSPESKGKTKDYAEELCEAVAVRWTDSKNASNLKTLLNETILNSKNLSNQVTDIRHTDQTTIPVDSPKIYKLIASKNINLAELIILTLPERFISEQNPSALKKSYAVDYNVDLTAAWRIKKKKIEDWSDEIDPDDIPF